MTQAMPAPETAEADSGHPAGNPFPGPKAYQRSDQGYFFGRGDEIEELTSLVLSSSATLLYAPSGTGKSSLLQAGVAPYLESRFKFVILPTVRLEAGGRPKAAEKRANEFVQVVCDTIAVDDTSPCVDIAAAAESRRHDDSERVLLILDQFEEVFDDPGLWRERLEFFQALTVALEENTWLRAVISLRSDYLADLVPYERSLPANLVVRYQLADMVQEQAAEVIAEAFARSGLALGAANLRAVLDALYENASAPDKEPSPLQYANTIQLQIVCRTLWDDLREKFGDGPVPDAILSRGSFGLSNSMVQFVDEAIREVMQRSNGSEPAVRWWLEHELITPLGRRGIISVDQDANTGLPWAVIDALEEVRLVQLEQRHGHRLAELTHDSMIVGVRASNDAWLQGARQRRRYAWVALLIVLIALLAGLGPLRVNRSGIVAGPLTGTLGGTAELSFTGQSGEAVTVNGSLLAHTYDTTVEVVEVQPHVKEKAIITQTLRSPGPNPITLVVRTEPGRAYIARLVGHSGETAGFTMTVFNRPAVPGEAPSTPIPPDVSGVGVLLDSPSGGGQAGSILIRVDGRYLRSLTGATVAVWNQSEKWAVVDRPAEPGVAMLDFDPVSPGAAPMPVRVRQARVDPPVRLGVHESVTRNVNPFQRISIDAAGSGQVGVELTCDGMDAVKVFQIDPAHKVGSPTNVGSDGTVIPLSGGPMELALYSPDDPAVCTASVKPYGAEPITANGWRDLELPQDVQAVAHPLNLSQDAAVIVARSRDVTPTLTCGGLVESNNNRYLAVVAARSPCELWLVRSAVSTGPVAVPVSVSTVADRRGG